VPPAAQQVAAPAAPAGSPPVATGPAAQPVLARGRRAARAQAREAAQTATPAEPVAVFDQGRRRSLWWIALPLLLLVAAGGGLAWYLKIRSSEHRLPALAGMTETEARALLKPLEFTLEVTPAADEQIPAGKIVSTDPAEGVTLREGDTVKAIVSSGPAPRRVPSLIGMTIAAATDELAADGLVPQRDADVFDEQVAAGSVVSFSVDGQPAAKAGDDVARGSVIRLVVSKGPKPRKAPQLRGLSTADATTVLDQLDLVLDVSSEAFSPDVLKGSIISQEPAANADVARGASVSVVVSKGPEMVAVPDVAGLTAAGIVNAVRAAGLSVDLAASSGDFDGALTSMTFEGKALKAGDLLPRGTRIVLNFD
jgi:serine/threonine-protein kinase